MLTILIKNLLPVLSKDFYQRPTLVQRLGRCQGSKLCTTFTYYIPSLFTYLYEVPVLVPVSGVRTLTVLRSYNVMEDSLGS